MIRFNEIVNWPRTMIIAHRGAGHAGPSKSIHENTLDAFDAAIAVGADAIEFDLRRTRNGVIVVHHDDKLANMKWSIGESTWEALEESSKELGYIIPTYKQTLEFCAGKIALDIELKETGYEKEIIDMVEQYYELGNIVFTSFHEISIQRIKEIKPQAITGLLLGSEPPAGARRRLDEILPGKLIESCRPDFIAPNWRFLKWLGPGKSAYGDRPIIAWTVNDVSYAEKLIDNRIAAIISDVPERLLPLAGTRDL